MKLQKYLVMKITNRLSGWVRWAFIWIIELKFIVSKMNWDDLLNWRKCTKTIHHKDRNNQNSLNLRKKKNNKIAAKSIDPRIHASVWSFRHLSYYLGDHMSDDANGTEKQAQRNWMPCLYFVLQAVVKHLPEKRNLHYNWT